jgi:mannose-1-phosphate guanylyltransferase
VALATLRIERDPDEVMLVLPADHQIADAEAERRALAVAARLAAGAFGIDAPLMTLGVKPDRPSSDYGYLVPDGDAQRTVDGVTTSVLKAFEEKPSRERAVELLGDPGTAWNAGIFAWRRSSIRDAIDRYTGLLTLLGTVGAGDSGLAAAYDQLRPLSVDQAVLEGAAGDRRVAMAALDVGWSDLGGWTALLGAVGATGTGRVVPPGTAAEAGPDDLIIERIDGRLVIGEGPRSILAPSATALLTGAAASRDAVEALVARVTAWEERA